MLHGALNILHTTFAGKCELSTHARGLLDADVSHDKAVLAEASCMEQCRGMHEMH